MGKEKGQDRERVVMGFFDMAISGCGMMREMALHGENLRQNMATAVVKRVIRVVDVNNGSLQESKMGNAKRAERSVSA